MMFASVCDMEPGMFFRCHPQDRPMLWLGVEPVTSRFAGKVRVRVLVSGGQSFVTDKARKFQVVNFNGRYAS